MKILFMNDIDCDADAWYVHIKIFLKDNVPQFGFPDAYYCGDMVNGEFYNRWNLLSHSFADDKIIKANFNNDSVDLVIEQHRWVISSPSHLHKENLYVTLERANIKSIEFNRTL